MLIVMDSTILEGALVMSIVNSYWWYEYCLFIGPALNLLNLIAGKVTYTWCQGVGAISHKFVPVSGKCLCKLSLGGIIAIKKCLAGWTHPHRVKNHDWNKHSLLSQAVYNYFYYSLLIFECSAGEAHSSPINHSCSLSANPILPILYL